MEFWSENQAFDDDTLSPSIRFADFALRIGRSAIGQVPNMDSERTLKWDRFIAGVLDSCNGLVERCWILCSLSISNYFSQIKLPEFGPVTA